MTLAAGFLLLVAWLGSWSAGGDLRDLLDPADTPADFTHCQGYGCMQRFRVSLGERDWQGLVRPLRTGAESPIAERRAVAEVIAAFERKVGELTGSGRDHPRARLFETEPGQLDCVDETVNTTTVLHLLQEAGLLRFHRPAAPARRGYVIDGRWPHNTAVLVERDSGRAFAVDSWYRANGQAPHIVPLDRWLAGWEPAAAHPAQGTP